jgi:hypothetical protein
MKHHHRPVQLPALPRPYPAGRQPKPTDSDRTRPLLLLVLLLQGLTLLLVAGGGAPTVLPPGALPPSAQSQSASVDVLAGHSEFTHERHRLEVAPLRQEVQSDEH